MLWILSPKGKPKTTAEQYFTALMTSVSLPQVTARSRLLRDYPLLLQGCRFTKQSYLRRSKTICLPSISSSEIGSRGKQSPTHAWEKLCKDAVLFMKNRRTAWAVGGRKAVLPMKPGTGDLGVTGGTTQRLSPRIAGTVSFAQGVPPREGLSPKKLLLKNGILEWAAL